MELQKLDIRSMQITAQQDSRIDRLSRAKSSVKGASSEKVDKVAQEFEAQFIAQMLQNMFSTIKTDGEFGGGEAEDTYRSMLVDEYGKLMARTGGIGVADHIKRELLRFQEVGAGHE
jgi:Rod binding domain-containing protein